MALALTVQTGRTLWFQLKPLLTFHILSGPEFRAPPPATTVNRKMRTPKADHEQNHAYRVVVLAETLTLLQESHVASEGELHAREEGQFVLGGDWALLASVEASVEEVSRQADVLVQVPIQARAPGHRFGG